MEYVLSFMLMATEYLALTLVGDAVFERRNNSERSFWFVVLSVLLATLIFNNLYGGYALLKSSLALLSFFMIIAINYRGSTVKTGFICTAFYITVYAVDYIVMIASLLFREYNFQSMVQDKGFYILSAFTAKLILFVLAFGFKYWSKRSMATGRLTYQLWFLLFFVPAFSVLNLSLVVDSSIRRGEISSWVAIDAAGLLLCNVIILFLWSKFEKDSQAILENQVLHQEIKNKVETVEALTEAYTEQRKATHDFNNQMFAIQGLLQNKNYEEAAAYIESWSKLPQVSAIVVHTNHPVVDTVLSQKYTVAKQKEIDMRFIVNDLSRLALTKENIVILLANLLDNAIEASAQTNGPREISVKFMRQATGTILSIRNTSLPVLIIDGKINTTKTNPIEHGFGIQNINRILQNNHCEYTMVYEDGWFQFTTILP